MRITRILLGKGSSVDLADRIDQAGVHLPRSRSFIWYLMSPMRGWVLECSCTRYVVRSLCSLSTCLSKLGQVVPIKLPLHLVPEDKHFQQGREGCRMAGNGGGEVPVKENGSSTASVLACYQNPAEDSRFTSRP